MTATDNHQVNHSMQYKSMFIDIHKYPLFVKVWHIHKLYQYNIKDSFALYNCTRLTKCVLYA